MTRILPRPLQESITRRVRERDQAKLERDVSGQDAFDAAPKGRDEAKPHGPLGGLPWSMRARHPMHDAAQFAPSWHQTRAGAIAAAKFAGLAIPFGFAGVLVGAANHFFMFGPRAFVAEESCGDAHPMATLGLTLGLVDAGLIAAKRYELAGALAAGIGAGTVANGFTVLHGSIFSGMIALVGGGSANVWRWYMRESTQHDAFLAIFRVVSPALQGLATGAGGVAGGVAAYRDLCTQIQAAADAATEV